MRLGKGGRVRRLIIVPEVSPYRKNSHGCCQWAIVGGQQGGDDLPGAGVHAQVQLTPGPAHLGTVFLVQPLARAAE